MYLTKIAINVKYNLLPTTLVLVHALACQCIQHIGYYYLLIYSRKRYTTTTVASQINWGPLDILRLGPSA